MLSSSIGRERCAHTAESGPDAGPGHLLLGDLLSPHRSGADGGRGVQSQRHSVPAGLCGGRPVLSSTAAPSQRRHPQDRPCHRSGPVLRIHRHHLRGQIHQPVQRRLSVRPAGGLYPLAGLSVLPPQALPKAGPGAGHGGDGHCPAHPVRRSAPRPGGRPVHPVRPVQRRLSPHH